MPPFKDESVIIISPGSQWTLAQLGLPESFTPPAWRFPTRMFPGQNPGEWEPTKITPKPHKTPKETPLFDSTAGNELNGPTVNGNRPADVEMQDAPKTDDPVEAVCVKKGDEVARPDDHVITYEEDPTSIEGAVYALKDGEVVNWPCFFALLTHINNTLSPPFHTPVIMISQPCWSARDRELLTQFYFETFKIPAFCLMDAALAACYAYGVPTALVLDVGFGKCDITAVVDFLVCDIGRGTAIKDVGGQGMTRRLLELLEKKGLDEPMCEALKRTGICEILPLDVPLPGQPESPEQEVLNPAAAASTGAADSGAATNGAIEADGTKVGTAPRGPGPGTEVGEEPQDGDDDDNEGVLDVASIVAKDNASEILAKREKERQEKLAAKKAGAGADGGKAVRLKNSEKPTASFSFEEFESIEGEPGRVRKRRRDIEVGIERFMAVSPPSSSASSSNSNSNSNKSKAGKNRSSEGILDTIATTIHRTILSVPDVSNRSGLWENLIILGNGSRIRGFTPALLTTLNQRYALSPSTATMFTSELPSNVSTPLPTGGTNTPVPGQSVHPMHHPAGHGVNPLLVAATHANQSQNQQQQQQQQQQNHHPQSSSLHVPNTDHPPSTPQAQHSLHASHQTPIQQQQQQLHHHHHRGHNQTPTTIKLVKPPEYFSEWKDSSSSSSSSAPATATKSKASASASASKASTSTATATTTTTNKTSTKNNNNSSSGNGDNGASSGSSNSNNGTGMEEAVFLGAQVAAKVAFVVDQGLSKGFLTRAEYNELGPGGVHDCAM